MNALAIVSEYNPFHDGHRYHISESRKLLRPDGIIAILGGDFMQRGEPARQAKEVRAEAAIAGGIDLALELPFAYAAQSAEYFARGAVEIADALGVVTHLSFGSESGDIEAIGKVAELLAEEPDNFKGALARGLAGGMSFPAARERAVREALGSKAALILKDSNDILGVEYVKALKKRRSKILPIAIKRNEEFPSASELRGERPAGNLNGLLKYIILRLEPEGLSEIFGMREGLENRICAAAANLSRNSSGGSSAGSSGMDEIVRKVSTKRYSHSTIRRLLINALVGFTASEAEEVHGSRRPYSRILAFNETGRKLIREIKKRKAENFSLIANPTRETHERLAGFRVDERAAGMWGMCFL
jgi:predicted nucleotidyltransferase